MCVPHISKVLNPLLDIIESGLPHLVHKWHHYLPLYHRHFEKYRKTASPENKVVILEIGVSKGGSLDMWNSYFGKDNCLLYGVDIDPSCKALETDNIKIFIGDREFLTSLKEHIPDLDILIDDGGHTMTQQITTFEVLFDHVKLGGVYLCEDTHTSYWSGFGGGLRSAGSFMERVKSLVDEINGYHYGGANDFTRSCLGIFIYDSMVFFEKPSHLLPNPTDKIWEPK